MIEIPEKLKYLLARKTRAIAFLALTLSDGSPHVTPIWFDWDGTHIILNTARGRVKDRVMRKKPRVALAIIATANMYRYLLIRGRVISETEEGAYDMIRSLNEKYTGKYEFPKNPGEVRVTYKVIPESVFPKGKAVEEGRE